MRKALALLLLLLLTTLAGCADEAPESPTDADIPGEAPATVELLLDETFSGSLPATDPEVVSATYVVFVPENATKMEVLYNATFTGAWSAVLTVYDPSGGERTSSLDACGTPEAGAQSTFSCLLKISKPKAGEWTLQLYWQVGEVNEEYTVDVAVWGLP